MEQAYVYQWTDKTTGMWYIGSRTRKGCHPDDGYICSSKIVYPLIKANPNNWIRDILFVGTSNEAMKLECKLLCEAKAAHNPMSYNQHNQNMKWFRTGCKDSVEVRQKKSKARLGSKNPSYGKRGKLSPNWGRKLPPKSKETIEKLSASLKGKPSWNKGKKMPVTTEETRLKISAALKGRESPNKGNICPNVGLSNKRRAGIKRPEHSAWMTGRTWNCKESTCPHCGTTGRGGNMKRYHFNNCKEN